MIGDVVNRNDLKSMSTDEMSRMICGHCTRNRLKLAAALLAEKRVSENRRGNNSRVGAEAERESPSQRGVHTNRRFPSFEPGRPSETWAGRGKTPRWLTAKLKSGKRIDEASVQQVA